VQETERHNVGSRAKSALTKLDLPAPLGATTINTFPATSDIGDNAKKLIKIKA
jgi:hypothetical protein